MQEIVTFAILRGVGDLWCSGYKEYVKEDCYY